MKSIFHENLQELSLEEMSNIVGGEKLSDWTLMALTWVGDHMPQTEYPCGVL